MSVTPDVAVAPPKPDLDGDHERMAHIVLEGVSTEDGDYVSAGPTVVEGIVNGTAGAGLVRQGLGAGPRPEEIPAVPNL